MKSNLKLTESDVKKQIKNCLWAIGAVPVPIWQGMMSKKGVSDILVCWKGKFIAIEVKASGWRPPGRDTVSYKHYYRQKTFIEQIQAAGGIAFFATSVEDVVAKLGLNVELYPLFEKTNSKAWIK